MTLVSLIAEIIGQLDQVNGNDYLFLHGDKAEQNLNDDTSFSVAYLGFPIESKDTLHKTGAITSVTPIEIYFGMKSEQDWTTQQHENESVEPMRSGAREFIIRCMKDQRIKEIKMNSRMDVKCFLDVCTSGCLLRCEITLVDVNSICV